MKKTLYIIRHGETDLNRQGIVQGSGVNAGLNDEGWRQARAFFEQYKDEDFELVLTSALRRTHETVSPFLAIGLPWRQFSELNEISWGEHEGKVNTPEMVDEYRVLTQRWSSGDLHACLREGESAMQMTARLLRFIERLKAQPQKKILICSHGRAMRCLLCLLKGYPPSNMERFGHGNTALYLAHFSGNRFEFELENDTRHLLAAKSYQDSSDL